MADLNTFKQPHIFLKIVEIVLLILVTSIFFSNIKGWKYYASSIILGCLINAIILLGSYLMGFIQIQQTPLELALYLYYGLGLLVSSILMMANSSPSLIVSGVFSLLLTLVYGADLYFAFAKVTASTFPRITNRPTSAAASNAPSTLDPTALPPPPYTSRPHSFYSSPQPRLSSVVDTGVTVMESSSFYMTNPTYPPAFDYPPTDTDNTSSYPRP